MDNPLGKHTRGQFSAVESKHTWRQRLQVHQEGQQEKRNACQWFYVCARAPGDLRLVYAIRLSMGPKMSDKSSKRFLVGGWGHIRKGDRPSWLFLLPGQKAKMIGLAT